MKFQLKVEKAAHDGREGEKDEVRGNRTKGTGDRYGGWSCPQIGEMRGGRLGKASKRDARSATRKGESAYGGFAIKNRRTGYELLYYRDARKDSLLFEREIRLIKSVPIHN